MPVLTAKQLRAGSPAEQLPFLVQRRYGEPRLYGKPSDVKAALLGDIVQMREFSEKHRGTAADFAQLEWLESQVAINCGADPVLPLEFDVCVDEYTGVRYQVTVVDRRMP